MSKNFSGSLELLAIVGPTASGKTALAIEIAKKHDGEIICADSRTVYEGMDIGTAKPSPEERATVSHHLLDVVSPDQVFTVADFKKLADKAIYDVKSKGKLPILAGGSGLYIDAVLYDFSFSDDIERDPGNPRHAHPEAQKTKKPLPEGTVVIGLDPGRQAIRQRIEARVEQMIEDGFSDEVRSLYEKYPNEKALLAPGYKAFVDYLNGSITLDEAKERFVINDSQLAKRQMTWFKRSSDIRWFDEPAEASKFIDSLLAPRG